MTDYHPLIARAVEGLDRSTGEARRALYERARTALVTQLRAVDPPLSESEITKERLALEDAIRKVEADAARKARVEQRDQRTAAAPLPRRDRPAGDGGRGDARRADSIGPKPTSGEPSETAVPRTATQPSARERLLSARAQQTPSIKRDGIKGFRDVVSEVHDLGSASAKAAQSARDTRDSYTPSHHASEDDAEPHALNDYQSEGDADDLSAEPYGGWQARNRQTGYGHEADDVDAALHGQRHQLHAGVDEHVPPRPARSYRGLIKLLVALIILVGVLATLSWQWPHITALFHSVSQIGIRQPAAPAREAASQPKFSGRVPQEGAGQAPAGAQPGSQSVPAVAQRVVLYEEDSNDPQGKRYVGSVIWRTETVSPGPGLAPELAVRADVEIPERHITMTWSLRRNTDPALPASHTIEIMFNLPADFPGGGIANVPGILMKQSEQARGTPLAGLAVKVTNGFFLIGLSAVDADLQRNIQLLKERPWFDIPIVYTNGGRAILALEKGTPGDRAFADAFAAWEKK